MSYFLFKIGEKSTFMLKKTWAWLFIISFFIFVGSTYYFYQRHSSFTPFPTYFHYTEAELNEPKKLKIDTALYAVDLREWDEILFNLIKKHELDDGQAAKIFAAVTLAQREMAYLSYNLKKKWVGNFDPVTLNIICYFFPQDCSQYVTDTDQYSEVIAKIIFDKLKKHLNEDNQPFSSYLPPHDAMHWAGVIPYTNQNIGAQKTWLIRAGHQFRPPPPPNQSQHEFWLQQSQQIQHTLANTTINQKKNAILWSGGPGSNTSQGKWLFLVTDYMFNQQNPLALTLDVRAVLMMGITDAIISTYDAKYTYWTKRPFMVDKNIISLMPASNTPSYPSNQSAIAGTAFTILKNFFPQQEHNWANIANDARSSCVIAGTCFPIDAKSGWEMGVKIGNATRKGKE